MDDSELQDVFRELADIDADELGASDQIALLQARATAALAEQAFQLGCIIESFARDERDAARAPFHSFRHGR